jgi:hypothetical protein
VWYIERSPLEVSRSGYLNIRITPGRRATLNAARAAIGSRASRFTDAETIDFALAWALASMPARLSKRSSARIAAATADAISGAHMADATAATTVLAHELVAVTKSHRGLRQR